MVLCKRFANIYQTMSLSERSLLHVVQEPHKSASPHGGERENVRSPANRATLVVRKKLRVHSHSPTFQVGTAICTLRLNHGFTSLAGEVGFVYRLAFYSTLEDR